MALNEALTKEEESQLSDMQNADRAAPAATETTQASTATTSDAGTLSNSTTPVEAHENKTVPVAEVIRQRERRQAAEKQLADERAERAKLQGRLETLEQLARQVGQPAETQIPDVNADPVGHFKAVAERQQRELNELKGFQQQSTQQTRQQQEFGQLIARASAQENEFRRATPDYDAASQFMREFRDRQLQAFGVTDPAVRAEQIRQDAEQIVRASQANNGNVAQMIYELAKASGYTPKAATTATTATTATQTPDERKVALAAKGQEQSGSIGQVRGGAAPAAPTLDALANMSDSEFAELTKGNKWKKLLVANGA